MKTIIVDDERYGRETLQTACIGLEDIEIIGCFSSALEAVEFAKSNWVELAFLDVEMPKMNGLEASEKLRQINPEMIVIFVSAHDNYMPDAFGRHNADYYIIKPYTQRDIIAVVSRAKLLSRRFAKRIYIETFGRFNVYLDGKPVTFTSQDAKELLALLVDRRGTALSTQEAFMTMWEDREYNRSTVVSLHKALRKLKDTLDKEGIGDLIIQLSPSEHRIDTDLFDCDYYQFLAGSPDAKKKYADHYMDNWSWGEETAAMLTDLVSRPD